MRTILFDYELVLIVDLLLVISDFTIFLEHDWWWWRYSKGDSYSVATAYLSFLACEFPSDYQTT